MKIEVLDDVADPRLEDYREVKEAWRVRERGVFLVEGRMAVKALLGADRFTVRSVLLTEAALPEIQPLWSAAEARGQSSLSGSRAFVLPPTAMSLVSGVRFHQGCIAAATVPGDIPIEGLLGSGVQRLLVLEDLTDPDNVGSCFRNALAFGFDAVLLTPKCAPPLYRKSIRTSMGAILKLPFTQVSQDLRELIDLGERGFGLVGLTPNAGARELAELGGNLPVVLIVGSEGTGLSARARSVVDLEVRIPMVPEADSLNVATAAGIAMHKIYEASDPG